MMWRGISGGAPSSTPVFDSVTLTQVLGQGIIPLHIQTSIHTLLSTLITIMGRSAKFTKRPSKQTKAATKTARESQKPLPPRVVVQVAAEENSAEGGDKGGKKRKMMRAKVDKVGICPVLILALSYGFRMPDSAICTGSPGKIIVC